MFQFACPECGSPIYSRNPQHAGGFRCLTCGHAPAAKSAAPRTTAVIDEEPVDAEPPALPEEWEVGTLLGKGGMGMVVRARHKLTGERAAVKIVLGEHATEPQYVKRFAREVQVLHKLRHPGIVGLLYSGVFQGRPWLAAELVEGGTLRGAMDQGPLAPVRAIELAAEIATALAYTHGEGVVHRDLKPENVLLDADGHAKVTDYGLAGLEDREQAASRLTRAGMVMGTLEYMSPEQMTDSATAGPPTDLYALGVMLFEMLAGRKPHGAERPSVGASGLPAALDDLVTRMLDRDPRRRPTGPQAADQLRALCQRRAPEAARPAITQLPVEAARKVAAKPAATSPPGAPTPPTPPNRVAAAPAGPLPGAASERDEASVRPADIGGTGGVWSSGTGDASAARLGDPAASPMPPQPSEIPSRLSPTRAPDATVEVASAVRTPIAIPLSPGWPHALPTPGQPATAMWEEGGAGSGSVARPLAAPIAAAAGILVLLAGGALFFSGGRGSGAPAPGTAAPAAVAVATTGSLFLESDPPGARILGARREPTGKVTPATLDGLPPGDYTFYVVQDGRGEAPALGTIHAGRTISHFVTLPLSAKP